MRIWDRIRVGEGAPIDAEFAPIVIIGDDVAEAVLAGRQPEFPLINPPFDEFVVEMRPSPWPVSFLVEWPIHNPSTADREWVSVGALVVFNRIRKPGDILRRFPHPESALSPEAVEKGRELIEAINSDDVFAVDVTVELEFPSGVVPMLSSVLLIEDNTLQYVKPDTPYRFRDVSPWAKLPFSGEELAPEDPRFVLGKGIVDSALMVISLIHCSNIKLDDQPPHYQRQERRRLGRSNTRPVTFKTLKIKPGNRPGSQPTGETRDGGVAIHIVRGHFKTFTPDAPLLGKHTGTYWWQPQVRGTAPRVVVKDYEYEGDGV